MKVCAICRGEKNIQDVDLVKRIPGDPRGDGTFVWMSEEICTRCLNLLNKRDWAAIASLAERAKKIAEALNEE